ncbi:acetylglutamate kinase [Paenibacillus sp. N3/727]|uniref:acetylglutamate kinase n=1 Tax=Paenibacillus sp. N3/727 TaxID=2925845 RepID=UPI001F53CCA2|nr:acetylglutamate kinase [Paenibacillus sp. N3/727]UNK21310.1 acetylglutamate kinase [Paenibacillus sp. N3/727]
MPYFVPNQYPTYFTTRSKCISEAQVDLMNYMRLLWEQHVAWTRMAIISIVFNLPDIDVVLARLLQNAPDMGNALKPFYGESIAITYSNLIKEHLVIAAELVKAAKAGDTKAVADAEKRWYSNADEIVVFLSHINPYIPKEEFRKMFYEHLALTKAEAVAMLNKDYKLSVQLYDRIELEALEMADMISEAIIKQFPQMF